MSELHKNAFWAYGVILALALREPLSYVTRHFIKDGISDWQVQLEVWRLFVFLILIVRFYLGAGIYFDNVYFRETTKDQYTRKSYPIDFLSGLFHFLLFFVCAVSLSLHEHIGGEVSYFLALIIVILLYDNVWWTASIVSRFNTVKQISDWSHYNNLITVVTAIVYAVVRFSRKDQVFAEHIAILPVLAFSLYDIKQVMNMYELQQPPPPNLTSNK